MRDSVDSLLDAAKEAVKKITSIPKKDLYIVWFSKTLQNTKALVSSVHSDGLYYEVTYNGDKKETYVDTYKKVTNSVIK